MHNFGSLNWLPGGGGGRGRVFCPDSPILVGYDVIFCAKCISNIIVFPLTASQAGDAYSSRAPGLTSGLQGSVNVHRGALLLVTQ